MRRYDTGNREDLTRCIASVEYWAGGSLFFLQCSRKRGCGPDGLYCKQHAKMLTQGKTVPVGRKEDA